MGGQSSGKVVFAALVIGLFIVVFEAPNAAARSDCAKRGSKTLRANKWARVYKERDGDLVACAFRTGFRTHLDSGTQRVPLFRLTGRYLGFNVIECREQCESRVEIDNLAPAGDFSITYLEGDDVLTDMVLTRQRSAAWIARNSDSLLRVETLGAVLDRGPDIKPRSLARSGRTLYWTNAGEPQSAELE
jgi:hypothetical protein